jgi:TPR repeat protein
MRALVLALVLAATPAFGNADLEARARAGDASAQIALGRSIADGGQAPADPAAAIRWFRMAADQGSGEGLYELALAHLRGAGVERDASRARELFAKAWDAGFAGGAYQLGLMDRRGLGQAPDLASSVRWLTRAAEKGHALAQARLGVDHLEGTGTPQNAFEAYVWLKLASQNGAPAILPQLKRAAASLDSAQTAAADREIARRGSTKP